MDGIRDSGDIRRHYDLHYRERDYVSSLIELEVGELIVWQLLSGLGAAKLVSPWPPKDDQAKPFGDLEIQFQATVKLSSKNSTLSLVSINSEISESKEC